MTKNQRTVGRRSVLRTAITGLGAAMVTAGISGCAVEDSAQPAQETPPSPNAENTPAQRGNGHILLAYFSRAGENYYYGGRTNRRWPAKHDTILVYVKDPTRYYFDAEAVDRIPYMAPSLVGAEKARETSAPTLAGMYERMGFVRP